MLLAQLGRRWWLLSWQMRILVGGLVCPYSLVGESLLDKVSSNALIELEAVVGDGCN